MTPAEITVLIKAGKTLHDIGKELGFWSKLKNVLRKKHRVLVLGCSGAGKSQFLKSLVSILPEAISSADRTQQAHEKLYEIGGSLFTITDTPGEMLHKAKRDKVVLQAIRDEAAVILNVVSNGYHEYAMGKEYAYTQRGDLRKTYLKEHREKELQQLDEWTSLLGGADSGTTLITVINKADLWWDERDAVHSYYQEGYYRECLGEAIHLNPMVTAVASVRQPFYEKTAMSGFFSDEDRMMLRVRFIQTLLDAIVKTA